MQSDHLCELFMCDARMQRMRGGKNLLFNHMAMAQASSFQLHPAPEITVTLSLELLATLESHNAACMFAGERIRATDRWNVTLTLKRFKGSKRVKGKEEAGGGGP